MSSKIGLPAAIAFTLTVAVGYSVHSIAAWRRYSALDCQIISNGNRISGAAIQAANESRAEIECSMWGTNQDPATSYSGFNLHYYDGHNGQSVQAQPCVEYYGDGGGTCGGLYQNNENGFTGYSTLAYPAGDTTWSSHPYDFAYIHLYLTQRNCGGGTCTLSYLWGAYPW